MNKQGWKRKKTHTSPVSSDEQDGPHAASPCSNVLTWPSALAGFDSMAASMEISWSWSLLTKVRWNEMVFRLGWCTNNVWFPWPNYSSKSTRLQTSNAANGSSKFLAEGSPSAIQLARTNNGRDGKSTYSQVNDSQASIKKNSHHIYWHIHTYTLQLKTEHVECFKNVRQHSTQYASLSTGLGIRVSHLLSDQAILKTGWTMGYSMCQPNWQIVLYYWKTLVCWFQVVQAMGHSGHTTNGAQSFFGASACLWFGSHLPESRPSPEGQKSTCGKPKRSEWGTFRNAGWSGHLLFLLWLFDVKN